MNQKKYHISLEITRDNKITGVEFTTFAKDVDEAMRIARMNYPSCEIIEVSRL